jgi:hypothetical protein
MFLSPKTSHNGHHTLSSELEKKWRDKNATLEKPSN